jgi:hypothetical protein
VKIASLNDMADSQSIALSQSRRRARTIKMTNKTEMTKSLLVLVVLGFAVGCRSNGSSSCGDVLGLLLQDRPHRLRHRSRLRLQRRNPQRRQRLFIDIDEDLRSNLGRHLRARVRLDGEAGRRRPDLRQRHVYLSVRSNPQSCQPERRDRGGRRMRAAGGVLHELHRFNLPLRCPGRRELIDG